MGRTQRDHLPGAAFHLTARTQDHIDSFAGGSCGLAEEIILDGVASSDAILLAEIVMPNHFHIVLRQGQRPLGWTMQPIMRRLTLLVQRAGRKGHVFERAYRSRLCESSDHIRRAIVYTHINAYRKSLCRDLMEYSWCSHGWYSDERPADLRFAHSAFGLQLFKNEPDDDPRTSYLKYLAWRMEKDRCEGLEIPFAQPEPQTSAGDAFFAVAFRGSVQPITDPRLDLRDRAEFLLRRIDATLDLNDLRRAYLPWQLSRLRREVICGLLQAGYRCRPIARFFNVSDPVVSKIASRMRYACLHKG